MDFLFSSSLDWFMAAFMAIMAVLLLLPVGEPIVDYLTPKDSFNNKQVFAVIEVTAALIVPVWPMYSMIYVVFILADLLAFGAYAKRLNR